jgi:multiple sugar transport system permease protein
MKEPGGLAAGELVQSALAPGRVLEHGRGNTRVAERATVYLVLLGLAVAFALPVFWLLSSAFKTQPQAYAIPAVLIPHPFVFDNFAKGISKFPFWITVGNSLMITVGVLAGRLLTASFTAYIFARIDFPFRNALFVLVLATMMVPYHVYLIPQYVLFRELGWLNSAKPLIVPSLFAQAPFYIFLFRQFFLSIPREYDEAAMIDGAGRWSIYWQLILPLSFPALGAAAVLSFLETWNDFLAPLIYLDEPKKQTVAIAIRTWDALAYQMGGSGAPLNEMMAVCLLVSMPAILLFFFAQRYFIQGVVMTGIKG